MERPEVNQPSDSTRGVPAAGTSRGGIGAPLSGATERIQLVIDAAEQAAAAIVADAQDQASRHVEEAELRANRLTRHRVHLMSELTDELVEQAATVKRQSAELIAALEQASRQLEASFGPASGGPGPALAPPPEPVREVLDRRQGTEPPEPVWDRGQAEAPLPLGAEAAQFGEERPISPPAPQSPLIRTRPEPSPAPAPRRNTGTGRASDGARLLAAQMAVAGSGRSEIYTRLREEFGIEDPRAILDEVVGPDA